MAGPYYGERPWLAELVPPDARRVLDVGCGEAHLALTLRRARPGIVVHGIEPRPDAAAVARPRLDALFEGPAEAGPPADWPAPDCVVFADVLEHLVDPWTVLAQYADTLAPSGTVVVCLPNVAHHTVLRRALGGRWDYADEGLLDRTHLRFFTVETACELVRDAGLDLELVRRRVGRPLPELALRVWRGLDRASPHLGPLARRALDALTYHVLIRARSRRARSR